MILLLVFCFQTITLLLFFLFKLTSKRCIFMFRIAFKSTSNEAVQLTFSFYPFQLLRGHNLSLVSSIHQFSFSKHFRLYSYHSSNRHSFLVLPSIFTIFLLNRSDCFIWAILDLIWLYFLTSLYFVWIKIVTEMFCFLNGIYQLLTIEFLVSF